MKYSSNSPNKQNKQVIESVDSMLHPKERERIQQIQHKTDAIRYEYKREAIVLSQQVDELLAEITRLQQTMHANQERLHDVQTELAILRHQRKQDDDAIVTRLMPMMSRLLGQAIHLSREDMTNAIAPLITDAIRAQIEHSSKDLADAMGPMMAEAIRVQIRESREEMVETIGPLMGEAIRVQIRDGRQEVVEAIGPVMGESIRVQIRDGREEMVEALYPIVGQTVQRAVNEFIGEFQRQIDAQLRATFGPEGFLRTLWARLRGVSPADLTLRDALPFAIRELFLIQRHSGLLMAHSDSNDLVTGDSDLISGMLTAVRDLVQDSFGHGGNHAQLDEIQYGDYRIIIQSGPAAYLAAVIEGVEPAGFHARLHAFISELHVRHDAVFRKYNGDPTILPNLHSTLVHWINGTMGITPKPNNSNRKTKWVFAGGGLASVLIVIFLCFYIQFTLALIPLAFPGMIPTTTPAPDSTAIVVAQPPLNNTPTPTSTPNPTSTPTRSLPTATAKATSTATATFAPTVTSSPTTRAVATATTDPSASLALGDTIVFTRGNVWIRDIPDISAARTGVLAVGANVTVLEFSEEWVKVEWVWQGEPDSGWIPIRWVLPSGDTP